MSKELDLIRNAITNRQQELNAIANNKRLEEERIRQEKISERAKLEREKELRSENNRLNIERLGVVGLFREIVDNNLVIWQGPTTIEEPVYRESFFSGRKKYIGKSSRIIDSSPAHIEWGEENCGIILGFNYWEWPAADKYSQSGSNYKTIGLFLPDKFDSTNPTLEACSITANEYPCALYQKGSSNCERKLKKPEIQKTKLLAINEIPNYIAQEISKTINQN